MNICGVRKLRGAALSYLVAQAEVLNWCFILVMQGPGLIWGVSSATRPAEI